MTTGFKPHYFKELATLETGNFWFRARNKIILWALRRYSPDMRSFLEVGCGTGFVIQAIAKKFPRTKLVGSDYFEEGLKYAKQRVPKAQFIKMDARKISYNATFDSLGAFDVLEHIDEDESVLVQLCKALKPEGIMIITVPQHEWLWSPVDEYACHIRRYNAGELHGKVCQAGFEILRSTSFVSTLLPMMYLSRRLQKNFSKRTMDSVVELQINPLLNRIFELFLTFEFVFINCGITLPFGGSRLLVARKLPVTRKE